jgi:hypothetical protein
LSLFVVVVVVTMMDGWVGSCVTTFKTANAKKEMVGKRVVSDEDAKIWWQDEIDRESTSIGAGMWLSTPLPAASNKNNSTHFMMAMEKSR